MPPIHSRVTLFNMPALIYLHGFLSSPLSKKAQQTEHWLAENYSVWEFHCPQLSPVPQTAKEKIVEVLNNIAGPKYLVGSSLGGFWASWVIEQQLADKAVLINPAVNPEKRFRLLLGETLKHYYSEETYTVNEDDLAELGRCAPLSITQTPRYWVLLQKGDEVLDYKLAETLFSSCKILIEEGGDHSFIDYEKKLPAIITFFKENI